MGKSLYIAEKPSVAREFAKALKYNMKNRDGYLESEEAYVTWCVGHLVTMSYPEAYDEKYRRWSLETIPFLPEVFRYEVIEGVKKQFAIVSGLLNRQDVETIYVCTDSGREGEYIYRLVEQQAGVKNKVRLRVWIDSQTEEEILRGIREAKDLSAYDRLSDAAYLRAKEDYLMGINFSRALTLKYSYSIKNYLGTDKAVVSVGRVMTCVLGMVVHREREIREFVKIPFYRVLLRAKLAGAPCSFEWKALEGSRYFQSPKLYRDNGFLEEAEADLFLAWLSEEPVEPPRLEALEKKKETKNPPLLYNLAELQNDCAKLFKISPDETLRIAQELYEKKLTTYPRTDARVLSTAVAKEIGKNIRGLQHYQIAAPFAAHILEEGSFSKIAKSRYVNDKQITDHYAIIPTGQGLSALGSLSPTAAKVYEVIVRRFLSIFYPAAVFSRLNVTVSMKGEAFVSGFKALVSQGYLEVAQNSFARKRAEEYTGEERSEEEQPSFDEAALLVIGAMKKGDALPFLSLEKKEGETSPPKRYNSGAMILAMENAGQFIEDEELRAQIKGSGIGTSATRAEILKKLVHIKYLDLNKKTQVITPTLFGEMIYEVVASSVKQLLDPRLTASWEKGLTLVASGEITQEEYMGKLCDFVARRTNAVKQMANQGALRERFQYASSFYQNAKKGKREQA